MRSIYLPAILFALWMLLPSRLRAQDEIRNGRLFVRNNMAAVNRSFAPPNRPVKPVRVVVKKNGRAFLTQLIGSNGDGQQWDLSPGEYDVQFSATGFATFTKRVTISSDDTTAILVELEKQPVVLGRYPAFSTLLEQYGTSQEARRHLK